MLVAPEGVCNSIEYKDGWRRCVCILSIITLTAPCVYPLMECSSHTQTGLHSHFRMVCSIDDWWAVNRFYLRGHGCFHWDGPLTVASVTEQPTAQVGTGPGPAHPPRTVPEMTEVLVRQLELPTGRPPLETVELACEQLGISPSGALTDKAQACMAAMGPFAAASESTGLTTDEMIEELVRQLDLPEGRPPLETIELACGQIGISPSGTLADKARACMAEIR